MSSHFNFPAFALGLVLLASPVTGRAETPPDPAPAVPTRGDRWRVVGFGGGGAMFYPAISPHDSALALVACDMTGTYVTHDAGVSWRMINLQQIARQFAFDPVDPAIVYARAGGLYQSTDRGQTWALVYPEPAEVRDFASIGDHADVSIVTTDRTKRRMTAFAVDPWDGKQLHAIVETDGKSSLVTSRDGGRHWASIARLDQAALDLFVDPASPAGDRTIFVTHEHGISVRTAGRWRTLPGPAGTEKLSGYAAGFDATRGKFVIYAIASKPNGPAAKAIPGIFISEDGGATWTNRQANLLAAFPKTREPDWRCIATCLQSPGTIYVSYGGLIGADGRETFGVARSADYGSTWSSSWQDHAGPANAPAAKPTIAGWLDERFGSDWGENPLSLGVDPRDPLICYATDFGRTIKTADGGRTWQQVYTQRRENHGWVSRGLDVTNANSIVFDPFDRSRAFLTVTDVGLMRSDDGGESWSSASAAPGIPTAWINTAYWLAADPGVPGRMWVTMSGVHDLPREKMWRKQEPSSYNGGILRTDDGGASWTVGQLDVGEAAVTHLLIDPQSSPDKRTLYACAFGHGVLKSTDGGAHWSRKNNGLASHSPLAWRIYLRPVDRVLFLVVARRRDGPEGDPEKDGAIYRSDDGAETWTRLALPAGVNAPTSLVVDSDAKGMLLLSAWGRKAPVSFAADFGGGIFRSPDDGRTWTGQLATDPHVYEITYDPRNRTHYACGFNAAAYRSTDDGATWERLRGYDFKWGKRVDLDPKDPDKVYIITYGGGVWHGPAR